MRFIPTRVHGMLDYAVGLLLIASPWLFQFNNNNAEMWVPITLGMSAIVYSLITRYELSLAPLISMRTHLTLDLLSGILLAVSPWLFGFSGFVWAPHLIFGLLEIGAALTTQTTPGVVSRHSHGPMAHV